MQSNNFHSLPSIKLTSRSTFVVFVLYIERSTNIVLSYLIISTTTICKAWRQGGDWDNMPRFKQQCSNIANRARDRKTETFIWTHYWHCFKPIELLREMLSKKNSCSKRLARVVFSMVGSLNQRK